MEHTPSDIDSVVELLVAVWTDVLGVPVMPDSGFFELGGTSLSAISVAVAVARHYPACEGVEMHALQGLLACPSLQAMAEDLAAFARSQRTAAI